MNQFISHTEISLNNDLFYYKTELIKFKIDKFLVDFSGYSVAKFSPLDVTLLFNQVKTITESRKNDTQHVFDYVYGL